MIEQDKSQNGGRKNADRSDRQCSFDPKKLDDSLDDALTELSAVFFLILDQHYSLGIQVDAKKVEINLDSMKHDRKYAEEWLLLINGRLEAADWIGDRIDRNILATDIKNIRAQFEIKNHVVDQLLTHALSNPVFMWGVCCYCLYMEGKTARSIKLVEKEQIFAQLSLMLFSALASEHILPIVRGLKEQQGAEIVAFVNLFAQHSRASESEAAVVSKEESARLLVFQMLTEEAQAIAQDFAKAFQVELSKGFKLSSLSYLLRHNKWQSPAPKETLKVHQHAYELFLKLVICLREPRHPAAVRHIAALLPNSDVLDELNRFLGAAAEKAALSWEHEQAKAKAASELEQRIKERQQETAKQIAAQRAASDLLRLSEFQSRFQTVSLPAETIELQGKLSSTAVLRQLEPSKLLCLDLIETHELFDYRGEVVDKLGDPDVQALVDIAYSKEALIRLLRACGITETKYLNQYGNPTDSSLEELTHKLSALYHKSHYMKEQLDILVKDESACLLIGAICLSQREVAEYAETTLRRRAQNSPQDAQSEQFVERIISRLDNTHSRRKLKDRIGSKYYKKEPGTSQNAGVNNQPPWFRQLEKTISNVMLYWDAVGGRCRVVPIEKPGAGFHVPAQNINTLEDAVETIVSLKERAISDFRVKHAAKRIQRRGFQLLRTSHGEITKVEHAAAAISIPVNPDKREWFKLEKAIALYDQYQQRLKNLQRALQAAEMQVISGGNRWSIMDTHGHELLNGDGPDIPQARFVQIEALIAQGRREQIITEQQRHAKLQRQKKLEDRRQAEAQEVIPQEGVPILVLDASVLFALLAPVSPLDETFTFLHVLKAAFAKFGRLYIPAKALFEVRGNVYWLDASGHVQNIEIVLHDYTDAKNTDSVIAQSAHLKLTGASSKSHLVKGQGHTAIVYVSTDADFFRCAQEHRDATLGKSIAMREHFQRRHSGGQLGDYAINDIIGSIRENCPVVVATGDGQFVRHQMTTRTVAGVQTQAISWQEIIRYLCTHAHNAFYQAGIQNIPKAERAIDKILDYLSSRGLGAGAVLNPRGKVIIGAEHLALMLEADSR